MSRLIFANLARLKKNKIFWLGIIVMAGIEIMQIQSYYRTQQHYANVPEIKMDFSLDEFMFFPLICIGIILAVIISLFIGTDYSDGTIRNKITVGWSRSRIYVANFISCTIVAVACYLAGMGVNIALGMPLLGGLQMKAVTACGLFVNGLLVAVAYAALVNFIAMITPNKVHGVVISILLAFVLLFMAVQIFEALHQPKMIAQADFAIDGEFVIEEVENPAYVAGAKKVLYQFFQEVMPSGQAMQIDKLNVPHPYRMAVCSVLLVVVCDLAGIMLFRKKNIV